MSKTKGIGGFLTADPFIFISVQRPLSVHHLADAPLLRDCLTLGVRRGFVIREAVQVCGAADPCRLGRQVKEFSG